MASTVDGYDDQAHAMYHVPQHSRREKLRFSDSNPLVLPIPSSSSSSLSPNPNPNLNSSCLGGFASRAFSLSLSSAALLEHAPSRPFTGYAAVLSGSRFLEPALQVLEAACGVGRDGAFFDGDRFGMEDACRAERVVNGLVLGKEQQWKKARLVSMLDEVCSRYTHYYQQLQAVIQAFESVAGLSTAAPYALMALQTMSKQFRCLTNLISDQLHLTDKTPGNEGIKTKDVPTFGVINTGVGGLRTASNSETYRQPPIWRPQRGLPERAVAVLRKWLFEHFLHPYPTDTDKQMLAKQTGLSRNQVSNWFINARVRLWKPMVEEVHSLELSQSHRFLAGDKNKNANEQPHLPPPDFIATHSENQTSVNACHWKNQYPTPKPFRSDLSQITHQIAEPLNFASNEISSHHDIGTGLGAAGRGNGGVTLTLGLHQSNGVRIHEPLHLNTVHSFGFDYGDAYVMDTIGGHDQHFGRSIGRHCIHDFVG
ncbi:Homeobox KN domain-containing protein [Dioscorea alata]|uniref:Homeobox KN domain-containing protein n=1 Tax=Dioscorea alata TaxID=55571 RepID=A0ACB7VGN8_DIOAL|nr:Homeobox KN domain-containing protein [Dioscorea alata]